MPVYQFLYSFNGLKRLIHVFKVGKKWHQLNKRWQACGYHVMDLLSGRTVPFRSQVIALRTQIDQPTWQMRPEAQECLSVADLCLQSVQGGAPW